METVAEALVDIFSRLGVPEEILSDLGTQFVSECMREVTQLLSIKQLTTTPCQPMCNGLTEKFNGTMKSMLKRLCSEQPRQWHRYINPLLFAYREVPQESTGFSPFELLYGRAVRGPMTILKQLWTKEVEEPEVKNSYQFVFELREKLEDTLKLAHSELEKAQQKGKHYYDRKSKVRKFQPGEKVLVLLPTDHNKLLMQLKGPFEDSSVVGLNDSKVKVKGKEKVYHANLFKKYFERQETTVEGAVAVGAGATSIDDAVDCAAAVDETEEEEVDFLELGGYVAKESIGNVTTRPILTDEQRTEFTDLAKRFTNLFTEAPVPQISFSIISSLLQTSRKTSVLALQSALSGLRWTFGKLHELHTFVIFAELKIFHFHCVVFLMAAETKELRQKPPHRRNKRFWSFGTKFFCLPQHLFFFLS